MLNITLIRPYYIIYALETWTLSMPVTMKCRKFLRKIFVGEGDYWWTTLIKLGRLGWAGHGAE